MGWTNLIFLAGMTGAGAGAGAEPPSTFLQTAQDLEKRIEEVEKKYESRIADLEQDVRLLEDQLDDAASPGEGERSTLMQVFNPSITAFGNFIGRIDDEKVFNEDGDRIDNRFFLREVEIDLRAAIDPWADGGIIVALEEEAPGEFEVGIEEGYVVLKRLPVLDASPWGLRTKAGRFRIAFGRLNVIHTHDLPWVTRPYSYQQFLGHEGHIGNGLSTAFFVPTPGESNALQATLQILGGGGGGGIIEEYEGSDPTGVGRLAWFFDLGSGHDIEAGGSALVGRYDREVITGFTVPGGQPIFTRFEGLLAQIYGADLTYKWKPFGSGQWQSFLLGFEAYYADLEQPSGPDHHPKGGFVWSQFQFTRNLFLGARYDVSEDPFAPSLETHSWSAWLSYYTTEFLRLRVGWEHFKSDVGGPGGLDGLDSAFIEFNFVIGAHPVEPYWVNR